MFFHKFLSKEICKHLKTSRIKEIDIFYNAKRSIYFSKSAARDGKVSHSLVKQQIPYSCKLDYITNVISREPQLVRVTWLINVWLLYIHGDDVSLCERALLRRRVRRRYCRANSSDRPFISITLLECNSVYAPSISGRVNLFRHRDNTSRDYYKLRHVKNLTAISCLQERN